MELLFDLHQCKCDENRAQKVYEPMSHSYLIFLNTQ